MTAPIGLGRSREKRWLKCERQSKSNDDKFARLEDFASALRRSARSTARYDPQAKDRYLRYSHREVDGAVPRLPAPDGTNERRSGFRVSAHGGATHLHQVTYAAAARSGRATGRTGRSARRVGSPPDRVREIQECGRDALPARNDRERELVESRRIAAGRSGTRAANDGRPVRPDRRLS